MRKCCLSITAAMLLLVPARASAQLALGCARPAQSTSPFAFVSVNGRCTDLSAFIVGQTKGWSLNTRATVSGATIDLSAIFDPDPGISFSGTTANPSLTATTYAFLFGTPIVPDMYSLALASVQFSATSVAGTTTVANSGTYPTFISGYGAVGATLTNLGVDVGSRNCVASGLAASTTCAAEQKSGSFSPTFYTNLEALLTYTQDNTLSTATFTGMVTLDKVNQVTVTPEPSSLLLLGTGLLAIGGYVSRRRDRRRA